MIRNVLNYTIFLLLLPALLASEEVTLKNGDRITGTILSYTQEEVILKTPYGILTFPREEVVNISLGKEGAMREEVPEEVKKEDSKIEEVGEGLKPAPAEEITQPKDPFKTLEEPLPFPKPTGPKSTAAALFFNIVPGGGYFYLGQTGTGLLTLVGESGLAYWGISLINEGKNNIGIPIMIGVGILRIADFVDVYEEAKATQEEPDLGFWYERYSPNR
ncbi:hypothetical protein IIA15_05305 [candidate division TA06 bacterium]|nr:hypothetical protein [candidate division TA06 bacterium]